MVSEVLKDKQAGSGLHKLGQHSTEGVSPQFTVVRSFENRTHSVSPFTVFPNG